MPTTTVPERAPHLPRIGDVVDGKYRIEAVLGHGGMGVVFAARHLGLDERVAIKFLGVPAAQAPRVVERFVREGRAAVKIRGEHVARMMDVGTLGDNPYLVMEYLDGRDLGALLAERRVLDAPLALTIVLQTCEALAEAHARGIVHRDLKPGNLFLAQRPDESISVKVLDFGISKNVSAAFGEEGPHTSSIEIVGTPHYMSPEQLRSARSVDGRTDIWSLGVILYELLSGERPFGGATVPEVFARILDHAPLPIRRLTKAASAKIESVIARCLEKDPARRFADVAELARAVAEAGAPDGKAAADRIERVLRATAARSGSVPTPRSFSPGVLGDARGLTVSNSMATGDAGPVGRSADHTLGAWSARPADGRRRAFFGALAGIGGTLIAVSSVGFYAWPPRTTAPVSAAAAPPPQPSEIASPSAATSIPRPTLEQAPLEPKLAEAVSARPLGSAPARPVSAPPRPRRAIVAASPSPSPAPAPPPQRSFDESRK